MELPRLYDPDAPPDLTYRGKMRWRYGDTKPVVAAVEESVRVEIGDLLWQDVTDAKPARELALHMAEPYKPAELQERFARLFLGVAMQRSPIGEVGPIRVATAGVFSFESEVGRAMLGSLAGPALSRDGTTLRDYWVALVRDPRRAIGRVARCEPHRQPYVLVDIHSAVMGPLILEE